MKICYLCTQEFASAELRKAHYATAHPGYKVGWVKSPEAKGFGVLTVTAPDGTTRAIPSTEMLRIKRQNEAKRSGIPLRGPGRPPVRVESFGPPAEPAAPSAPNPGESDAPAGSASGPTRINQPPIRPTVSAVQGNVRESIRDSLDLTMLADLIRDFSVTLSEADGAGEAGKFSASQSMMLAKLMYDSTVDLIVDRFGGNVGRFKMGLAALVILLTKGSVHARAIGAKVNAQGFAVRAPKLAVPPLPPDYADAYREPIEVNSEPVVDLDGPPALAGQDAPVGSDIIAELAAKQRALTSTPRTAS